MAPSFPSTGRLSSPNIPVDSLAILLSHRAITQTGSTIHPRPRVPHVNFLPEQYSISDRPTDAQELDVSPGRNTRIPSSALPPLLRPLHTRSHTRPGPLSLLESPGIGFVNLRDGSGHAHLQEAARWKDLRLIELAASKARTRFRVVNHNTTLVDPHGAVRPEDIPQQVHQRREGVQYGIPGGLDLENGVLSCYLHQGDETIFSRGSISMKSASSDRLRFKVKAASVPGKRGAEKEILTRSSNFERTPKTGSHGTFSEPNCK
ncbi:hypothetical protein FPV67DRAFT_1679970 [Lyophyllum atratum]|nr:hypothetical protein FPV67DRAFT_1679970 [Lyophyllum atratum]